MLFLLHFLLLIVRTPPIAAFWFLIWKKPQAAGNELCQWESLVVQAGVCEFVHPSRCELNKIYAEARGQTQCGNQITYRGWLYLTQISSHRAATFSYPPLFSALVCTFLPQQQFGAFLLSVPIRFNFSIQPLLVQVSLAEPWGLIYKTYLPSLCMKVVSSMFAPWSCGYTIIC